MTPDIKLNQHKLEYRTVSLNQSIKYRTDIGRQTQSSQILYQIW